MAIGTGMTDLGMASRPLNSTELMTYPGLTPTEIARDGIAVITHTGNAVTSLTLTQLAAVFAGTTTNWMALGGPNAPIVVYVREVGSGTRDFFRGVVLGTTDFPATAMPEMGNGGVMAAVAADPNGIGFMSFGSVNAMMVAVVSLDAGMGAVVPSQATIRNQSYPITRPLLLVLPPMPITLARQFVDFALTPQGQMIATQLGFVSII
jgi:phosphate transport system substrate-binding protein